MIEKIVFDTIEKRIGVPFVADDSSRASVCFACDEEVRSDFKIQFTNTDIVNYVYGIVLELDSKEKDITSLKIPYPVNADFFWQYCTIGNKFRQQQFIKEIELIPVNQLNWESH